MTTSNNWRITLKSVKYYRAIPSLLTFILSFLLFSTVTIINATPCEGQECVNTKNSTGLLVVATDKDNIGSRNSINVINPYIREMPPGQTISASFMTLKNNSNNDIALNNISSTIAKRVELHQHTEVNGMMEMRQVKKITIPAKGEVSLKPGGYHAMLFDIKEGMKSGDSAELKLSFDNGTEQTIKVDVMDIMEAMELKQ